MLRYRLLFCSLLFTCLSLQGQKDDHVQGSEALDIESLYDKLSDGQLEKDTSKIFEASHDLLIHFTVQGKWDSIYFYSEKVAESALVLGLMDKHIKSYLNNLTMDEMFGGDEALLNKRYDYLQGFLNDENLSIISRTDIAIILATKYSRSGQSDSTLFYQKMAVDLADIEDNHENRRVITRLQLALYYREYGKSAEALQHLIEIESEIENTMTPTNSKMYFYSGMAMTLININDLNRASDYLEKYKYHVEESGYTTNYTKYFHIKANLRSKLGDSRGAIKSLYSALENSSSTNSKVRPLDIWTRLTKEYHRIGALDSMKIYVDSLARYKDELNDRRSVRYNVLLHRLAMSNDNYTLAYKYLRFINEKYSHVNVDEESIMLLNNKYYEKIGDTQNAYHYYKKYSRVKDSLRTTQNFALAKSIETRYNRDKQDAEINLLTVTNAAQDKALAVRNNTILLGSIMLALLTVLLFGLYRLYRRNQESQKQLAVQNKQISKALEQNQILIKEIHHRVKNNLQVVSSLLSLQERKVDDEATKEALKSSQTRVQTMSLIHKSLYQKDDVRSIDIKNYFKQLTENLVSSFAVNAVNLRLDIDEMNIDIDSLVPLGLVANELICNALKHGIKDKDDALLRVSLKHMNDKIVLSVEDSGGNLGTDHLIRKEGSLGTRLIHAFTDNLEGRLDVSGGKTTKVSLIIDRNKITFSK